MKVLLGSCIEMLRMNKTKCNDFLFPKILTQGFVHYGSLNWYNVFCIALESGCLRWRGISKGPDLNFKAGVTSSQQEITGNAGHGWARSEK